MREVSRFCAGVRQRYPTRVVKKPPLSWTMRAKKPCFTALSNVVRRRGGEAAQTILDVRGTVWRFVFCAPFDPQGSPLVCQSAGALG